MTYVLKCLALALFVVPAFGQGLVDAPFGLREGLKLDEIQKLLSNYQPLNTYMGVSKSVPEPVSIFDSYALSAPEPTGLCRVAGFTKYTASNQQISEDYEILRDALVKKYGKSKSLDFSKPYTESMDLIMAVSVESRRKAEIWKINHKPGIENILLEVVPGESIEGSVMVKYDFSNSNECNQAINQLKTEGL